MLVTYDRTITFIETLLCINPDEYINNNSYVLAEKACYGINRSSIIKGSLIPIVDRCRLHPSAFIFHLTNNYSLFYSIYARITIIDSILTNADYFAW